MVPPIRNRVVPKMAFTMCVQFCALDTNHFTVNMGSIPNVPLLHFPPSSPHPLSALRIGPTLRSVLSGLRWQVNSVLAMVGAQRVYCTAPVAANFEEL